jgi:hypothetical protein
MPVDLRSEAMYVLCLCIKKLSKSRLSLWNFVAMWQCGFDRWIESSTYLLIGCDLTGYVSKCVDLCASTLNFKPVHWTLRIVFYEFTPLENPLTTYNELISITQHGESPKYCYAYV